MGTFIQELQELINRYSLEGSSNTPDFILAKYLQGCLTVWDTCTCERDKWYFEKHASEIFTSPEQINSGGEIKPFGDRR